MNNDEINNNIIKIYNKYGTYKSLLKDIKIITYFMNHPNQEIRQKTMLQYFSKWSEKTVIRHLKKLVKQNLLKESQRFNGTYIYKPEYIKDTQEDMEMLARTILGDKIFELSIKSYITKQEQIENEIHGYEPYIGQSIKKKQYRHYPHY
ncbi:hypothetical protein ACFL1L_01075 [Thermoplasmatota archaeon]